MYISFPQRRRALTLHRESVTVWSIGYPPKSNFEMSVFEVTNSMGEGLLSVAARSQGQLHRQRPPPTWVTGHESQIPRGHCTTGRLTGLLQVALQVWAHLSAVLTAYIILGREETIELVGLGDFLKLQGVIPEFYGTSLPFKIECFIPEETK